MLLSCSIGAFFRLRPQLPSTWRGWPRTPSTASSPAACAAPIARPRLHSSRPSSSSTGGWVVFGWASRVAYSLNLKIKHPTMHTMQARPLLRARGLLLQQSPEFPVPACPPCLRRLHVLLCAASRGAPAFWHRQHVPHRRVHPPPHLEEVHRG